MPDHAAGTWMRSQDDANAFLQHAAQGLAVILHRLTDRKIQMGRALAGGQAEEVDQRQDSGCNLKGILKFQISCIYMFCVTCFRVCRKLNGQTWH